MIKLLLNVRHQKGARTRSLQCKNQAISTSQKANLIALFSIALGKILPEEALLMKVQYVLMGILMATHTSQRAFYRT